MEFLKNKVLRRFSAVKRLDLYIRNQDTDSHSNGFWPIVANEKADALAKKGASIDQRMICPCSFNQIKLLVNLTLRKIHGQNMIQSEGDRRWKILKEDKLNILSYPVKTAVALFTGVTAHNCLQNGLYRTGVTDSPNYVFCDCNQSMTFEQLYGRNGLLQTQGHC